MNNKVKGHLKIERIYPDKTEVVLDDPNTIVSGMGVILSYLFAGEGSDNILDYQIKYAQLGWGSQTLDPSVYSLDDPVDDAEEYGENAIQTYLDPIENGSITIENAFYKIPYHAIAKVSDTSVRYSILIEEDALLGSTDVSEIGLFVKNYQGNAEDNPILVAYKTFTALTKSTDFALLFTWTITW